MTVHLCDTNVWLALSLSGHVHHTAARAWFDSREEPDSVVFCRATQQSLLRLLTNATVLAPYGNPPLTNKEAWDLYQELIADDRITIRAREPAGVESRWRDLATRGTASPKLWMDAYLAAYALAGSYRLITTDAGFRQFPDLDLRLLDRRTDH